MPNGLKEIPSDVLDRRTFGRRQTVWHAWIKPPNGSRFACIVRNVSSGGALLECDVPGWLGHEFRLIVDDFNIDVECELRHRGQHGVGVKFKERLQHEAAMSPDRPLGQGLTKAAAEKLHRHQLFS